MKSGYVKAVRIAASLLLALYVAGAGVVLLANESVIATEAIQRTQTLLVGNGAPGWMTYGDRVQMMLNALIFAPLVALGRLALPDPSWSFWVALAFVASGAVEVWQAFALEPRSAEYVDVVANTLGGLIGSVAVGPLVPLLRDGSGGVGEPVGT